MAFQQISGVTFTCIPTFTMTEYRNGVARPSKGEKGNFGKGLFDDHWFDFVMTN